MNFDFYLFFWKQLNFCGVYKGMKTLKLRIYPNKTQKEQIEQHIGCCRFIYNRSLERRTQHYQETNKTLSKFDLNKEITQLKKLDEFSWLKEVNSQSLQQAVSRLDTAFSAFFKRNSGFPKFQSRKKSSQSFDVPQHFKIDFDQKWVKLPKIGFIKFRDKMNFRNWKNPRMITVKREDDQYFVCVVCESEDKPIKESPTPENSVGIDLGIKTFATLSDGTKIEKPRYAPQGKGKRQRKDFLHKLSTKLVENQDWQTIIVEDMHVKDMLQNTKIKNVNKAVQDCSWRMFLNMLEYKCKERGKNFKLVSPFEAASQTCTCGKKTKLDVSQREWTCKHCGTTHDRDILAAQNIKKFGSGEQIVAKTGGTHL